MGKSSKIKQRQAEEAEAKFQQVFAERSREAAYKTVAAPLIVEFERYRRYFVRDEDSFQLRTRSAHRDKQALEMARHLFGRFRVPHVLEQAWSTYVNQSLNRNARGELPRQGRGAAGARQNAPASSNINLADIDFRAWYICVARGGSLYKEHTKALLTKKETFLFLSAPASLGLCQSVLYAVARAAGATDGAAQRLARSKLVEKRFEPFWFDAIRFFCLPDNMPVSLDVTNDLVDYIAARRLEDGNFRLLGSSQSLAAVLRRMEQWHRALARAKDLSGITWNGVALPDHQIEQRDPEHQHRVVLWDFHQITTGKELAAEGTAQRHCVLSYKSRCVNGDCSIWSLTRTDAFGAKVRRLTIEVNRYGSIVQKRGLANRSARPEEEHVVGQWATKFNLDNRRGW